MRGLQIGIASLVDIPHRMSCCVPVELRGVSVVGLELWSAVIVLESSVGNFVLEDCPDVRLRVNSRKRGDRLGGTSRNDGGRAGPEGKKVDGGEEGVGLDSAGSWALSRIQVLLQSANTHKLRTRLTKSSSTSDRASSSNQSGKSISIFKIFWNVR